MRLFFLAVAMMISIPAFAEEPKLPNALEQQKLAGGQVIYLGQHGSMHGWVLVRRGQPEFYYAPEDGSALVMGILFDKEGRPVTPAQVSAIRGDAQRNLSNMVKPVVPEVPAMPAQEAPVQEAPTQTAPSKETPVVSVPQVGAINLQKPEPEVAPTPARQLYNDVKNGAKLLWGREGVPVIYAFIDPNCGHCRRFMNEIAPFVDEGRVAVEILPVGFRQNSINQAAFMLAADDGVERLLRYKDGDASALPDDNISTTAVDHNLNVLTDWDLRLTPVIIYETPKGDIRLVRGRPYDVPSLIKDALGE